MEAVDVFISYKQNERAAIEQVAERLRTLGLSVWFDASMSAGESFNDAIDREARSAKAMLVCWSPAARESRWVKAEAMIGFEQDKLVACYVAGPDGFSPPTPFNTSHVEDLRGWFASSLETYAGWKSVLRRVGKLCGRKDLETWGALPANASAGELRAWISAHGSGPLLMVAEGLLRERQSAEVEREHFEHVARERGAEVASERGAQEEAQWRADEEAELKAQDAETRQRTRSLALPLARAGGVIVGVALIAAVVLYVIAEPARATYSSDVEGNFVAECQSQGSSAALCRCTWDKIESEVRAADFYELERWPDAPAAHRARVQINGYLEACRASVEGPETQAEQGVRIAP